MPQCYRATIAAMPAFHPLADTLASAVRTLVLLGVLTAAAGLPAAAVARLRAGGVWPWLAAFAGPAITVHALNLLLVLVLTAWIGIDAARHASWPSPAQFALFAASFVLPNSLGLAAWSYVARRRPPQAPPHVVPSPPEL
jgi:hypothetical protein